MKRVIISMVLLFALGTVVHAQDKVKDKPSFQWNKSTMDSLGISPDVQAKINEIKKSNDGEIKTVKADNSLSEEQRKEKIKELHKKRMKSIDDLLTPEQQSKARALRKG